MISLLLIFPLLAYLMLFIFKKSSLNNLLLNIYAGIHFVGTVGLCFGKDLYPFLPKLPFFDVNGRNIIFLFVLSVVFLAVTIYNNGYIKLETVSARKIRHYTYMVLFFVFSMTGAVLSSNLAVSWVFIEATTLASAYLIYFHKTKHSIEAAWKYVFICSIGIALAFVGIILLSVATGNLNSLAFDDLYLNAQNFNKFWLNLSFVFILFGIGTKMGLAPVHFWLPDAHAEAPTPISALLSASLLNSAFLIIMNVFGVMVLSGCDHYARIMMLTMGFLSLFVTAVFVYHINNYKRMLAYSSIENMGILIIGLALGGVASMAAILHMVGHSLIKAAFFLTSGNILSVYSTKKIKSVVGLISVDKKTAWLWIASFVGIVAFPPSVLFLSEFFVIKEMLVKDQIGLCVVFLLLLTIVLYGLAKSVFRMAFSPILDDKLKALLVNVNNLDWTRYVPQICLLLAAFVLGLCAPEYFLNLVRNTVIGF